MAPLVHLPFWAAVPKGSMTFTFTHMGNFLLLPLLPHSPSPSDPTLEAQIPVLRPKSQLEAQIPFWRPKFSLRGPNLSLVAKIPALKPKS